MNEIVGLLWLAAGLGGLLSGAGVAACCLRLRSALEFLLAIYVIAWSWLVLVTLALSPGRLVTRGWLGVAIAAGVCSALVAWNAAGRLRPPAFSPALAAGRSALRDPLLLVLAIVVGTGALYSLALALFTPVNEWDALAYQLARATF